MKDDLLPILCLGAALLALLVVPRPERPAGCSAADLKIVAAETRRAACGSPVASRAACGDSVASRAVAECGGPRFDGLPSAAVDASHVGAYTDAASVIFRR